ncbi:MAG: 5-(carboxyamino)imidazole ribonucleotide synthase [Neomegalonema sp.]|nr:5-(carboxyamino)imidazole ribonucleotide synthase [Neomegalonema sp.]
MTQFDASEGGQPVRPGGVVGILGGGQLGRMLAVAAAKLGLKTHIYAPDADCPASEVATKFTRGSDDYHRGLSAFAEECDVVTLEFENVPVASADLVSRSTPMRPSRLALETAQDRVVEKDFLCGIGVQTAAYAAVDGISDIAKALQELGGGAILKTRRMGYDGRGQARLSASSAQEAEEKARAAYAQIGRAPAILEALVPFRREISVIVARGVGGEIVCYDPSENLHEAGILRRSMVVSGAIDATVAAKAHEIARSIVSALAYVGVMGVELFELENGELLVNEVAPRVHNTGHWTIEACPVSQFEQHIRAVCGWPLGGAQRHSDVAMTNLIGQEAAEWASIAADPELSLHLYGKAEIRDGRKMGHVTRLLLPVAT